MRCLLRCLGIALFSIGASSAVQAKTGPSDGLGLAGALISIGFAPGL